MKHRRPPRFATPSGPRADAVRLTAAVAPLSHALHANEAVLNAAVDVMTMIEKAAKSSAIPLQELPRLQAKYRVMEQAMEAAVEAQKRAVDAYQAAVDDKPQGPPAAPPAGSDPAVS
jgi:hypothetical protein